MSTKPKKKVPLSIGICMMPVAAYMPLMAQHSNIHDKKSLQVMKTYFKYTKNTGADELKKFG